jgi:hypothetical protein
MVIDGHSLNDVGAELYRRGIAAPRGGKWGHSQVRNMLTNPALIGLLNYEYRDETGQQRSMSIKARWDALVPEDKFHAVARVLDRRSESPTGQRRKRQEIYPLSGIIRCSGCGAIYNGGRRSAAQGGARVYVHPHLQERTDPERHRRYKAAGCSRWTVLADELERKIKDLITGERASEDYEAHLRTVLQERGSTRLRALAQVSATQVRIEELQRERTSIARLQMDAAKRGVATDVYWSEIEVLDNQIKRAQRDLERDHKLAKESDALWRRVQSAIHETRNLAAIWNSLSLIERKRVLDMWVDAVQIAVEPIEGRKRANHKYGVIYLESAPGVPKALLIGPEEEGSSSASINSSRTQPSDSTSSRSRSASTAASVPIRPSAHAACPRTSGSSSDSAPASTGTASGEPQLPSATATLRSSPRRLARFTGERLNRAENSSCDSAINSTSLAPCTPARGQNADSSVIWTNLEVLNGQTS